MPNLFKDCVTCGVPRDSETEFYSDGNRRKTGESKKRKDCVYCCRERRKKYFHNPEKRAEINNRRRKDYKNDDGYRKEQNRKHALKALYGLTIEQYDQMRAAQDFKCAVCFISETEAVRGKLYVDHSHKTGQVRGLLCAQCNSALGLFKEDLNIIQKAIRFLSK